uniref:RH1 domain-containing protein n=1 Tax=Rhodnius prolixus TaxID=13249 RepID=T1HJU5_RHOPR
MPGNLFTEMEEYEGISVMDVYDIVTDFAKEFRPIIEMYGPDPLNNVMSKVVTILEHLEAQTVKIGRLQTNLQEKDAIIARLERDKMEKAADRARFEKELEQIEEHWREESHEMVAVVNRLQEENRKLLKALATKQDTSTGNHCNY